MASSHSAPPPSENASRSTSSHSSSADASPDRGVDARALLGDINGEVQGTFSRNRRVLSFDEYFALVCARPALFGRSAAQYLKDVFDHFGVEERKTPRGTVRRFKLFDCAWDGGRDHLVGQEEVQGRVYRAISNFVREGRVNKLILLHGPNGSAKSTLVACLGRALEHYSTLDEGALYRFHWVFPSQQQQRGGIGFGGSSDEPGHAGHSGSYASFAHLDDALVDARLRDELRDNPLLLLPAARRRELFAQLAPDFRPPDYILRGDLGHKNKQIFEALLSQYKGDWLRVMRHVQVERFYLSRRYREGLVTVEPQLAVDASNRQITMDRSLQSLPPALQAISLSAYGGDLVDANRGLIEYADLLKRPLEAYKYLLGTVEQARVPVEGTIMFLDQVFIASSNEGHLAAFKEMPEFQSFRGRMELIRVPYLLDYLAEERIYADQIGAPSQGRDGHAGKHVAPHTALVAALWSVLTRMRKPLPEKYAKSLGEIVSRLGPLEKAELYARGVTPPGLTPEQQKELAASVDQLWSESDAYPNYEGRIGASPREVKTLIMNAAQNSAHACLSPVAVFEEIEELVKNVSVYEFLKQEPLAGGYHENRKFVQTVQARWIDLVDDEVRDAMGLVEERRYTELFGRYVSHVSHWVKKEKIKNPMTNRYEEPDEELMSEVERTLGIGATPAQGKVVKAEEYRRDTISRIAAWSIDHPQEKLDYAQVFPRQFQLLRDAYFAERRKIIQKTIEDALVFLAEGKPNAGVDAESQRRVETTIEGLTSRFGYCQKCAREALSKLLVRRYA